MLLALNIRDPAAQLPKPLAVEPGVLSSFLHDVKKATRITGMKRSFFMVVSLF
jgi:hypothetical protein